MDTLIPLTEDTRAQIAALMDGMIVAAEDRGLTEEERAAFDLLQRAHNLMVEVQIVRARVVRKVTS